MATLTIRNLPDDVRDRLRVQAARNGRSMEAEARAILGSATDFAETAGAAGLGSFQEKGQAPFDAQSQQAALAEVRALVRKHYKPHPEDVGLTAVDALIRDRRRDALLELIKDGDHPRDVLGKKYFQTLSEAHWTEANVETLWQDMRERQRQERQDRGS